MTEAASRPAATGPPPNASLRRARWAVTLMFLLNGAALGTWVSRIPVVQEHLGLDEAALGAALLGLSLGVVAALPVAGGAVTRVGSRRVAATGALTMMIALPLVALATSGPLLFAALVVLGAGMSSMDVSMNSLGVAVENRLGRRVMVSFHGAWSLGGLGGTGLGGLAISGGLTTTTQLVGSGALIGVLALVAVRQAAAAETARRTTPGPALAWPRSGLWVIGAVAATSALGEGAVADWAGVYLRDVVGASAATAATGFLVFSLTMAAMRFAGDAVAERLGPAGVVRVGGAVAGAGFLLALAVPEVPVTLVGFGLAGVGVATVVPLSFAVAGSRPGVSEGEAVAAVATVAYSAMLAGPPLIGFLAHLVGLRLALLVIGVAVTSLTLTGRALRR